MQVRTGIVCLGSHSDDTEVPPRAERLRNPCLPNRPGSASKFQIRSEASRTNGYRDRYGAFHIPIPILLAQISPFLTARLVLWSSQNSKHSTPSQTIHLPPYSFLALKPYARAGPTSILKPFSVTHKACSLFSPLRIIPFRPSFSEPVRVGFLLPFCWIADPTAINATKKFFLFFCYPYHLYPPPSMKLQIAKLLSRTELST